MGSFIGQGIQVEGGQVQALRWKLSQWFRNNKPADVVGLRGGGEGRGDKTALCDSEGLVFILRAEGIHHGFLALQKAELGLEPRRSP